MKFLSTAALTLLSSVLLSVTATKVAIPEATIDETINEFIDFDKAMDLYFNPKTDIKKLTEWFNNGLDYTKNTILIDNYDKIDDEAKTQIIDHVYEKCFDELIKSGRKVHKTKLDKRCDIFTGGACELLCGIPITACEFNNLPPEELLKINCIPQYCKSCYEKCYI